MVSRIFDIHGDAIKLDISTYISTHKRSRFIDKDFGEFYSTVNSILSGRTNRKRGRLKSKQTCKDKYGVDNVSLVPEVREKKKQKSMKKYGTEFVFQAKEVKNKIKDTILERYGVEFAGASAEITQRQADTFNSKSTEELAAITNKRKQTCLDKYGVESPLQNKDILRRTQETNLERYGNICTLNNEKVQKKARQTCMDRFGVEWPTQSDEVMKRVQETNLKKYGVRWTQQNIDVAKKSAKSVNKSILLYNWETKDEVICIGSYEVAVVKYLNTNRTRYMWQPRTFEVRDGSFYTPDCYIVEEDMWVEIKGYFRKDALEKWTLFRKKYPNSELWDKGKLKALNIL